jgi:hypothetical protein
LEDLIKHLQEMIRLHFPSTLGMDFSRVLQQAVHDGEAEQKKFAGFKQGDEAYGQAAVPKVALGHSQKWLLQGNMVLHPNPKS